jgi:hypothetical protein
VEEIISAIGLRPSDLFPVGSGATESPSKARPSKSTKSPEEVRRETENLKATWKKCIPQAERLGRYLLHRGLSGKIPSSLKLHPALGYYDGDGNLIGNYPVMIAPVQGVNGELIGLHRTYLDPAGDGKAQVVAPKKLSGSSKGGAIRLAKAGETLAITEGIETGLAVMEATNTPTWAAICANGLKAVELPPDVKRVEIWADHDGNGVGQKAAEEAATRFVQEGKKVYLMVPPASGRDWLDVLTQHGPTALQDVRKNAKEYMPPLSRGAIRMSDVQPEPIRWLWRNRIPLGKITVIDGDPGLGKSVLTLNLAARISTGEPMPDGTPGISGGVVILSAEDGWGDTIRPRLEAAGADLLRIVALTFVGDDARLPSLPSDLGVIENDIKSVGAVLLIIDPLMAYLGEGINSFRDQDVRRALAPLAEMANRLGVAVVIVRHLNKDEKVSALYRGGGSIGIIGAARSGLLVAKHPEDPERQRVLAGLKSNLGPPPVSLAYRIEGADNQAIQIVWLGETSYKAQELLGQSPDDEERSALEDAKGVLADILSGRPVQASEVEAQAKEAGVKERTLKRAKAALGVKSRRMGFGGPWVWELPSSHNEGNVPIEGQPPVSHLAPYGALAPYDEGSVTERDKGGQEGTDIKGSDGVMASVEGQDPHRGPKGGSRVWHPMGGETGTKGEGGQGFEEGVL